VSSASAWSTIADSPTRRLAGVVGVVGVVGAWWLTRLVQPVV
jgi:hypothetical protein